MSAIKPPPPSHAVVEKRDDGVITLELDGKLYTAKPSPRTSCAGCVFDHYHNGCRIVPCFEDAGEPFTQSIVWVAA